MTPVWRRDDLDGRATAVLLACCVFWGFQQVLIKATLAELPPLFQAGVRFVAATAVLWLWCRWRHVALFGHDGTLWVGVLAGLLFTLEFAALYVALQYTTASRATLFLYTSPFWVALVVPIFVRAERLRASQWFGLACAFAAVAFALGGGGLLAAGTASWRGDLLALAAGLAWGLTTVVVRCTTLAQVSAEKTLFYKVAASALILPPLSLLLGETWVWNWSGFALVSVALQALIGAFASYLAWVWLILHYPATRVSSFVFLTPLVALGLGAAWLGEPVTPSLVTALALVAVGIVLVNRKPAGSAARKASPT